ncbi:hypothetical protein OM427_15895 [Halomonas sp. 18H]|nr:hypothetical protein [Halomonas sp. 18H]MCW4151015.1 hypothetical protein [Halomonas sp. 18H]
MIGAQPVSRHCAAGRLPNATSAAIVAANTPAKPMWTSVLMLKLRGFSFALEWADTLRQIFQVFIDVINIPAKPMAAPAVTLKSRGFFITCHHDTPRRLFTVLAMLTYLTTQLSPDTRWPDRLHALLEEYPDIPRGPMGFPNDWQARLASLHSQPSAAAGSAQTQ